MMHGHEKSDSAIVAVKPTNKAEHSAAEQSTPDSPAGEMAGARRTRLLQLPRRADELSLTRGLPSRGC